MFFAAKKCKIIEHVTIFSAKKLMRKKSKEEKQSLAELNSAHRRSQGKCQPVQTSYIKRIKLFLFLSCNKHLINRLHSRSVWENLDLGRVYRPHCARSVLTISVTILKYGLIRHPSDLMLVSAAFFTMPCLYGPDKSELIVRKTS